MPSREAILNAVRANKPEPMPQPDLNQNWITYPDKAEQFLKVLASVGGRGEVIDSTGAVAGRIDEIVAELKSAHICSLTSDYQGNVDLSAISSPKELETVDLAIIPCQLGVAENGAVWIPGRTMSDRTVLFITQHLVFTLPVSTLVNNMHEAYAQLKWGEREFGIFVSGPSKTADIEQSLVIGAHGARSLTVLLVNDL